MSVAQLAEELQKLAIDAGTRQVSGMERHDRLRKLSADASKALEWVR
jgi:hypothetical protein